jgi:hypothetical protein
VYGVATNNLMNNTIQNTKTKNTNKSNTSAQNFACFFRKDDIFMYFEIINKTKNLAEFFSQMSYIRIIQKNKLKKHEKTKKAECNKKPV